MTSETVQHGPKLFWIYGGDGGLGCVKAVSAMLPEVDSNQLAIERLSEANHTQIMFSTLVQTSHRHVTVVRFCLPDFSPLSPAKRLGIRAEACMRLDASSGGKLELERT